MTPIDPALRDALSAFEMRAMRVAFVKAALAAAAVVVTALEIGALLGVGGWAVVIAVIGVALGACVVVVVRTRVSLVAIARQIDSRGRLHDLIVSAMQCDGDGMAAAVRRAAVAELETVRPHAMFPLEMPKHWKPAIAAVVLVQTVLVPFVFRAPAARPPAASATSLNIPAAARSAPPASTAASPRTDDPTREPSTLSVTSASTPSGATTRALEQGPVAAAAQMHASADTDVNGGRKRSLALAAAADVESGHIPARRRAIVDKYFASILNTGKTPK